MVLQPNKRKTGLIMNAVDFSSTSLDLRGTATFSVAARPYQMPSDVLRHNRKAYLFSPSGSMNISDLFDQLENHNPKHYMERNLRHFCYATTSRDFS